MSYIIGILFAISAGCFINLGVLLQKKVINDHLEDPEFLKSLTKSRIWVLGMIIQMILGGLLFYMLAQAFLGPALVPGLMSAGMIVLAIGSTKILGETLKKEEITGILLMIVGIFIFSMSELSIDVTTYNFLDSGFILRISIFTATYLLTAFIFKYFAGKDAKFKGILYAMVSGMIYSLTSIWIGPLVSTITHIFGGTLNLAELILFIPAAVITIFATIFGVVYAQNSFREGQANLLSPLIGVPGQITPIMGYFLVFILTPPTIFSIIFMILGLVIITASTFLLATRQVKLEGIQAESS